MPLPVDRLSVLDVRSRKRVREFLIQGGIGLAIMIAIFAAGSHTWHELGHAAVRVFRFYSFIDFMRAIDQACSGRLGRTRARRYRAWRLGTVVTAEPVVVSYEASHRWNGQLPATMLGGGTAPTAMFTLPASVGQQAAQR